MSNLDNLDYLNEFIKNNEELVDQIIEHDVRSNDQEDVKTVVEEILSTIVEVIGKNSDIVVD